MKIFITGLKSGNSANIAADLSIFEKFGYSEELNYVKYKITNETVHWFLTTKQKGTSARGIQAIVGKTSKIMKNINSNLLQFRILLPKGCNIKRERIIIKAYCTDFKTKPPHFSFKIPLGMFHYEEKEQMSLTLKPSNTMSEAINLINSNLKQGKDNEIFFIRENEDGSCRIVKMTEQEL